MDQQVLTRVQTRWVKLGFFQSISPTIQYNLRKANISANALSRSRHGLEGELKESMLGQPLVGMAVSVAVPDRDADLVIGIAGGP